jgi:hypothetical protein
MKDIQNNLDSWHQAFAEWLRELFVPLNLAVFPELPVVGKPPRVDIMFFQREQAVWTKEQLERLPDGIRQSKASYILLEFKYTESVNEEAFVQARTYDYLYKRYQQLTDKEVQTFIVSSKKPRQNTRKKWGYETTICQGVYNSNNEFLKNIPLISLNELVRERHNAYFKLFCSHKVERENAFKMLDHYGLPLLPEPLESLLSGLRLLKGEQEMRELTPKEVQEMGRQWGNRYLSMLSPEERFIGLKPEERVRGLKPEERLKGLKPEEQLAGLSDKEIMACLKRRKKQN